MFVFDVSDGVCMEADIGKVDDTPEGSSFCLPLLLSWESGSGSEGLVGIMSSHEGRSSTMIVGLVFDSGFCGELDSCSEKVVGITSSHEGRSSTMIVESGVLGVCTGPFSHQPAFCCGPV